MKAAETEKRWGAIELDNLRKFGFGPDQNQINVRFGSNQTRSELDLQ